MKISQKLYLQLLFFHIVIGILFFFIPFLGKIYGVVVFLYGLKYVIQTQNKNNEVILLAAYFTGLEVYLRMLDAVFLYEYGKYTVIVYMVVGIFYKGFSKGAFLYVVFIALLVPGIFVAAQNLSLEANIRKAIAFNISGPICLAIAAIYCFKRNISFERFKDVLAMLMFPLVAMLVNLFLYNPSIKDVVVSTQSNFETSGGFGPNQVSTVLGLGMFLAFSRLLLVSSTRKMQIINIVLIVLFAFRCIVTFSRGGMYTGLLMMFLLLLLLFSLVDAKAKAKIMATAGVAVFAGILIWGFSSLQTGGLIDKRYTNKDAQGREKASMMSGRETIIATELDMFIENPLLGVGVGRNKEVRLEESGVEIATHNEITRMLSEHGSLGIMGLLILILVPLVLYFDNRLLIFTLIFSLFWLLTINHAAMRIAAPAFMYALSLLKINFYEDSAVHRE